MEDPPNTDRRSLLTALGAAVVSAGCMADPPFESSRTPASPTSSTRPTDPAPTGFATPTATRTDTETPTPTPNPAVAVGESVDALRRFEADWTVEGGEAAVTREAYGDLPAVTLRSNGDNRVRISRRFDEPRDFSGWDLSIAAQLRATTKEVLQLSVTLIDVHGEWRRLSGAIRSTATDRWVRLDVSVREDAGADLRSIRDLRIEHWVGDADSTFAIADLRRHPEPEKGYVMFTFDDGPSEDYTVAYDVLSRYDFAGAAFPHTKTITGPRGPSVEQYREMVADGWDVGGHTRNHAHLPNYSRREQRRILTENRAFLAEHDLTPEVFRTPFGAYDQHTLDLMAELFDLSIVANGSATGTNLAISDPTTVGFDPGDDYERTKRYIDTAVEYNRLLGLTIHMARLSSRAAFEAVVQHADGYVANGELEVITPMQLYSEHIRD